MEIILLDGRKMTSRDKMYDYLEETMRFPDYFGHNLDALNDCLSELGEDVVIVLYNTADMQESLGRYADRVLSVMGTAAEETGFVFLVR